MKSFVYTLRGLDDASRASAIEQLFCETQGIAEAHVHLATPYRDGYAEITYRDSVIDREREAMETLLAETLKQGSGVEMVLPALADEYILGDAPKRPRRVSLGAAIATTVTAVLLAVLLTFSLCTMYQRNHTPQTVTPGEGTVAENRFEELETIDRLFRMLSVEDIDDEAFMPALLKAYVAATGDLYAEYFTKEEYDDMTAEQNGTMYGVGISVVNDILTVDGVEYQTMIVANVYSESPAEKAGVLPGDAIMIVGSGEDRVMVNSIGYTEALNRLRGEKGTDAVFTVYRASDSVEGGYEAVEFTITRDEITTRSVISHVCTTDSSVGILRVVSFDNTTPSQFSEAMDSLMAQGCERFVFDMRNNPGGLLTSVQDVLAYFLDEGDLVISTKDRAGNETMSYVSLETSGEHAVYGSGDLTAEDIGKYKGVECAVLTNQYTASAAELFSANFRDYEMGTLVGVTTFGKGSMQSTYPLAYYGYEGALKLTTRYYYPPSGEGYHGIGITPDIEVELSEEAAGYNVNLLPDELDNQLQEAIRAFKD